MAEIDCPRAMWAGLVRHCNVRTEYVLIEHVFQPESCSECLLIEAIVTGQSS